MFSQAWFDIETLLNDSQPESVLLIGARGPEPLAHYTEQMRFLRRPCRVRFIHRDDVLQELPRAGRFAAGVVSETLEHLDKTLAGQLIARLRDLHTAQFCMVVPVGRDWPDLTSYWQPADLFGFGMTLVNQHTVEGRQLHVYKYDITTYKHTPEWLNPRDWANPELWDKYRW